MKTNESISPELEAKLKNSDPEIQDFISALQLELIKLQKKNIRLEANNVSLDARINALEGELEEYHGLKNLSIPERTAWIKRLEDSFDKNST